MKKEEKVEPKKEEKKYVTTEKKEKKNEEEKKQNSEEGEEKKEEDKEQTENLSRQDLIAKYVAKDEILLTKILCIHMERTPLSDLDNITIKIDQPKKIEGGLFSKSYITYLITTEPLNLSVRRRYNDFEWLRNILINLFPQNVIPKYSKIRNAGDRFGDEYTKKRIRTLEKFLVYLLKDPLLKNSQIIYDFLSINKDDEFNNKKITYNKLRTPSNLNEIKSIDAEEKVILNPENENFIIKVKKNSDINVLLFKQLSSDLRDVKFHMDNMSQSLKNLSTTFDNLTKNKFANDEYMMNCYENLKTFTNNWSDSIKIQSELIEVNLREFFKFFKKEYNVIKEYAQKVENLRNNYYKAEEKLQNRKLYLFERVEVSKWEINTSEIIDAIAIKKDKELAFMKMIPKETENVYQLKLNYGFYTEKLVEEYQRLKRIMGLDIHEVMDKYFSQQNKITNAFNDEVEHIFSQIKNVTFNEKEEEKKNEKEEEKTNENKEEKKEDNNSKKEKVSLFPK